MIMKTIIAALALLSVVATPVIVSTYDWQPREGDAGIYVPYPGGNCWRYFGGPKGGLWPGECL
jgi:hypothetical protein